MARLPRQISRSMTYHIMLRGNEKKSIFLDDEDRSRFIDTLRKKKADGKFKLYAYCLMDNHVHLLVSETTNSISRIMQGINASYAIYFNKKYNRVGHLFQDRFKSEAVDSDNYLLSVVRYIHNNPVKAGIVKCIEDYRWSSYREYLKNDARDKEIVDTGPILEILSSDINQAKSKFIEMSNAYVQKEHIDISIEYDTIPARINTRQGAVDLIVKFLDEKGVTLSEIKKQKGRIKGTLKHEIIVKLKSETSLSCREIGELLGVNKTTVHELT